MPETVDKWWSARLSKQGVPADVASRIIGWVKKKATKDTLWDVLVNDAVTELSTEQKKESRSIQRDAEKKNEAAQERYNKALETARKLGGKAGRIATDEAEQELQKERNAIDREQKASVRKLEADGNRKAKDIARDVWPHIQGYIRCLVPDAVIDPSHFNNICPVCNARHEETNDGLVEYNQICSNCGKVLPSGYVCVCPLCNSGLSVTVKECGHGKGFDPLFELMPRIIGVFEDLDHFPPFTPEARSHDDWAEDYKKWNSPECRYVLVCPICLYKWSIVIWIPPQIWNEKLLCPVCGSKMKATGKRGKEGGEEVVCTNPECETGDIGIIHGGEG
jgi:hypothetical protein